MMSAFMLITFLIISISFNFLVDGYVERDITDQLSSTISDLVHYNVMVPIGGYIVDVRDVSVDTLNQYPALKWQLYNDIYQRVSDTIVKSQYYSISPVLYSNDGYTRIYPDDRYFYVYDIEEIDTFLASLKKIQNTSSSGDILKNTTVKGNYYYTNIDLGKQFGLDGQNLLLFVNTSKYDYLTKNIANMLIYVLIAETVIMFVFVIFISRSITKPIEALSTFAGRIGRGDFSGQDFKFIDRELINLNNVMNDAANKLKANDEDQNTFFQNVSHELRTPLMSIKGYSEGIKYGVFTDEKDLAESAGVIISETDRLADLVEDLLYVSRMDAYKTTEITGEANLTDIVGGCVDKLRGLFISSGKEIDFIYPDAELNIKCDEKSLMRAVINMISNAARYAKTKVTVSLCKENGQAILKIQDDGNGIKEEDLPNIFKRFYKGESGKYGIGLSITKTILDHHNADIKAESNQTGALFTVEFILKGDNNYV